MNDAAAVGLLLGGFVASVVFRRRLAQVALDITPLVYSKVPWNELTFALRTRRKRNARAVLLPQERKEQLFAYSAEAQELARLEKRLRARFELGPLHESSTCHQYRENLYVLSLLDEHVGPHLPRRETLSAIDVGSQDFRYATALERFLRWGGGAEMPRTVHLCGVELDGNGLYKDGHTRADYAEAYARQTGNPKVTYSVSDFLRHEGPRADVITFFFPFVLRYALVRWGLPTRHFAPEKLFQRAVHRLNPGGLLVVVNHTQEEHEAQKVLLSKLSEITILATAPIDARLLDYGAGVAERRIMVAVKG